MKAHRKANPDGTVEYHAPPFRGENCRECGTEIAMSDEQEAEIKSRYGGGIVERFQLTGELRQPRKGEWYWWTGKHGPAACQADTDRPFNAPILIERKEVRTYAG